MKRILFTAVTLFLSFVLNAQIIDKVYINNGAIYDGYISEQIPGTSISVYAQKAELTFQKKSIERFREDFRKVNALSEAAQEFLADKVQSEYVKLCSFISDGICYDDCYALTNNDESLRVVCFTPQTYILPWNDVKKTTKVAPLNTNIRDVVTIISGERLVGSVTEQNIGENLIVTDSDGRQRLVSAPDVMSIRTEVVSKYVDLWSQVPLLDRVYFRDGSMIEGFIASRVMGKSLYIIKNGEVDEIPYQAKNVVRYQKTPNRLYQQEKSSTVKVKDNADRDQVSTHVVREEKNKNNTTRQSKSEPDPEVSIIINDKSAVLSKVTPSYDYLNIDPKNHLQLPLSSKIRISVTGIPVGATAELYKVKIVNSKSDEDFGQPESYYRYAYYAKSIDSSIWTEEAGGTFTAEIEVSRAGIYFLAIAGNETGIAIEFI